MNVDFQLLHRQLADALAKRASLALMGVSDVVLATQDREISRLQREIAGVSEPTAGLSRRITLRPSVFIETASDSVATGHCVALDILVDERLTRDQKVAELTESIVGMLLNDSLPDAAEQVYGIVHLLVETCSIKAAT